MFANCILFLSVNKKININKNFIYFFISILNFSLKKKKLYNFFFFINVKISHGLFILVIA